MEVALTFGAVGDFISIALLIKDIVTALNDCRGSARDYREIVENLTLLESTLQEVDKIYRNPVFSNDIDELTASSLGITNQIRLCLERFQDKVRKYRRSFADGGSGNVLKDAARKVQWKLEDKDTAKFRADVVGYTTSLKLLLEVTTMRIVQRNHEALTKQLLDTEDRTKVAIRGSRQMLKGYVGLVGRRIFSRLDFLSKLGLDLKKSTSDMFSMIFSMSQDFSTIKAVIMRLERPLPDEHFVLEDATGHAFPIHLKTITSWEAFEYILNDRFRGKKGAHRIRRRRYSLQERTSHRQVDQSIHWESAFLPHQKVDMSLMCSDAENIAEAGTSASCPWCRTVSVGEMGKEVQCKNCKLFFARVIELDDRDTTPSRSLRSNTKRKDRADGSDDDGDDTCVNCHASKRIKGMGRTGRKRHAPGPESDSDDGDIQGLKRITMVSKRRRTQSSVLSLQQFRSGDALEARSNVADKDLVLRMRYDTLVSNGSTLRQIHGSIEDQHETGPREKGNIESIWLPVKVGEIVTTKDLELSHTRWPAGERTDFDGGNSDQYVQTGEKYAIPVEIIDHEPERTPSPRGFDPLRRTASSPRYTSDGYLAPKDTILLSSEEDYQKSTDAPLASQSTGAMSWAFIKAVKKNPQQSYVQLLNSIRDELQREYSQKPQLSCSHPLDTDLSFVM